MTLQTLYQIQRPHRPAVAHTVLWNGVLDKERARQAAARVPEKQRVTFSLLGPDVAESLHGHDSLVYAGESVRVGLR